YWELRNFFDRRMQINKDLEVDLAIIESKFIILKATRKYNEEYFFELKRHMEQGFSELSKQILLNIKDSNNLFYTNLELIDFGSEFEGKEIVEKCKNKLVNIEAKFVDILNSFFRKQITKIKGEDYANERKKDLIDLLKNHWQSLDILCRELDQDFIESLDYISLSICNYHHSLVGDIWNNLMDFIGTILGFTILITIVVIGIVILSSLYEMIFGN
ncbi:MAG: hypothetical protein ACRC37_02695, partial [Lentisphaeria bacterium]